MANTQKTLARDANGQLVGIQLDQGSGAAGPLTAVTPNGAAGQGATPDQAKMAGTPAQKAPVLDQAVAQGQTLAGQQRLTSAPAVASVADVAEQAAGATLSKLGSYGSRIKALVNTRLAAVAAQPIASEVQAGGALQIDPAAVDKLLVGKDTATQASIRAALDTYVKGGRTEAQLAALANAVGPDGLAALSGTALNGTVKQDLAAAGKVGSGAITLKELDLSQAGINPDELAADLGVTRQQLDTFSPDQLQAQVEAATNQRFSDTEALKAEYPSATDARKQQISALLRQRGEMGASAVEAAVADLGQRLEAQEEVEIGGQFYNIKDLLSDEGVSNLITDAVNTPAQLEALAKTQPGLAAWITKNKTSLEHLTGDIAQQVTNLQKTQESYSTLVQGLPSQTPEMLAAFGLASPNQTQTTESIAAAKAKLEASPTYQAMQADADIKTLLQSNPGLVKEFDSRGLTAPQIAETVKQSTELKDNPVAMQLAGIADAGAVLFPTPAQAAAFGAYKASLDQISPELQSQEGFQFLLKNSKKMLGRDTLASLARAPQTLADPTFLALLKDGTVDSFSEVRLLADKPDMLAAIKLGRDRQALVTDLKKDHPQREMLGLLFGDANVDVPDLVAGLNVRPTKAQIAQFDTNRDGKIGVNDFEPAGLRTLAATLASAMPNASTILAGKGNTLTYDPFESLAKMVGNYSAAGHKLAEKAKAAADALAAEKQAKKDVDAEYRRQLDTEALTVPDPVKFEGVDAAGALNPLGGAPQLPPIGTGDPEADALTRALNKKQSKDLAKYLPADWRTQGVQS